MSYKVTISVAIDAEHSSIGKSKNYRIYTTTEPVSYAESFGGFSDFVMFNGNPEANVLRQLRYSTDRYNWSLWYDINEIQNIILDPNQALYVDVKYTYDDGTTNQLTDPIDVDTINIQVNTTKPQPLPDNTFTPSTNCSLECTPAFQEAAANAFQPYQVGSLVDVQKALSYQTNVLFGHQVVYFRTAPDTTAGDFIFKEWTLFQSTDRRCIKILVPNNEFPDNKPQFSDFGVDFVAPFEVHIDAQYFESIFGRNAEPRVRDFMYIPLMNRMYEIKSCYLFRGLLYQPIYWKIQLVKYQQHSDTKLRDNDKQILNNLLTNAENLFEKQVKTDTLDAVNPQQYRTISLFQDETRERCNRQLKVKQIDMSYNYSPLIQWYYDLNTINSAPFTYSLDASITDMTSQAIVGAPATLVAGQNSQIYNAWRSGYLNQYDINIGQNGGAYLGITGPNNTFNEVLGRQIVLSGYSRTTITPANQVPLLYTPAIGNVPAKITLRGRDAAIVYKSNASYVKNMTLAMLINVATAANNQTFTIFKGFDNETNTGVKLLGTYASNNLTITLIINTTTYVFTPVAITANNWCSLIVPISAEYSQLALYMYSFMADQANVKNWTGVTKLTKQVKNATIQANVNTEAKWELVSGPLGVANIRVFNTMLQEEDHEFMLSQQYLRDESMLVLVDNCKPRLNIPFIAINR
jgi:hypothetical protein